MVDERTFVMIKPDGVQRGLISEIIHRFERKGYKLVALRFCKPALSVFEEHYKEHLGKPFYKPLLDFITSGPVVPMVWEGKDVVAQSRKLIGETDPLKASVGTIRGDLAISKSNNVIHGSDSLESAKREISIWFKAEEIINWKKDSDKFIYE